MRSPWKWAEYYIRLRLYTFRYLLEFSLSCTLLYSKLPGPFQINPRSVLWNWNPTYPVSTPSSRLSDTTHSPVVFPIFFCVSQILDVILRWNCCRRRRKSVRSSFQVWANPVVAKKPRAGGFLLFWPFANFWIWNLLFWIWNLHFGNLRCPMINYHPQRGRADASDWAPLLQPQRSRDEANFEQWRWEISNLIRDSIARLRKIWVASFKDNSWRQDSAGEVCLQSLSQAVGRSLQPPLYLQGPPQLLSLVQGLQESSNKVPRGPRCPPWNLKLRCQAFQPSWGLLLMEGFFYPQWRQLREKK